MKRRQADATAVLLNLFVIFCFVATSPALAQHEGGQESAASADGDHSTDKSGENAGENAGQKSEDEPDETLPGHSYHGGAFNEGPRQQAYLMGGTGEVHFEVTTDSEEAQKFFNQGIGQIHGFWDLEAERTFRHVASLDEDCAMAYWGAALATVRNQERSAGFIEEAVKRKKQVTEREQKYIDALAAYINNKSKDKKDRAAKYLKALESIALDYPDDIEAKALVAHRIWQNGREGIPVASYVAADALLREIYEKAPLHPAHHYTIHLWDYRKPEMALDSARKCGAAAPSIAHMWHMPGHIYSRLKRYEEAVYQQEASARVDHNHMMRDRVMPDEIFNYAHNNEWLIRNLVFIGRVKDALSLAKNMIELPQHPKYNTLKKPGGSASYGRRRLLQVLREYQLYDDAVALCDSTYLRVADNPGEEIKRLRLLGCAATMLGKKEIADKATSDLQWIFDQQEKEREELKRRVEILTLATDKSEDRPPQPQSLVEGIDLEKAPEELSEKKKALSKAKQLSGQSKKAMKAIDGYRDTADEKFADAYTKLKEATGEDVSWLGELQVRSGKEEEGLKTLRQQVKRRPKEVIPLARLAYFEHQLGKQDEAKETFEKLRDASTVMDIELPLFQRLSALAQSLGHETDWRKRSVLIQPSELSPELDTLGPFRWSGPKAPSWELIDGDDQIVSSSEFDGQATLMIFFLGHGCLHCADQLKAFGPRVSDFQAAGIEIVAVSTDESEKLIESINNYGSELPFAKLLSDGDLKTFKKFRAFDDFEQQALHGTFLIDKDGYIRWQDISYEPFMDHEFLFVESQRLLSQQRKPVSPVTVQNGSEEADSDTEPSGENRP